MVCTLQHGEAAPIIQPSRRQALPLLSVQTEVSNHTPWNYFNYGTITFQCIE